MIMQMLQSLRRLPWIRHRAGRKLKKPRKTKIFSKRIGRKCRLVKTRIEQNNDHTGIMCEIQFV